SLPTPPTRPPTPTLFPYTTLFRSYLLQHAENPVDWYEWGEEALARARDEDRPVLLSIGYAACHWCHVMEHESFEDDETAALMNRSEEHTSELQSRSDLVCRLLLEK